MFQRKNKWKGVAAGAAAGLLASFAMNRFQSAWSAAAKKLSGDRDKQSGGGGESANVKAAEAISRKIFCHELTEEEKGWAGPAVHYTLGTLLGTMYGTLAETNPGVRVAGGAGYGAAVWLGADEIAVPAAGFSKPAWEIPASSHVYALASHLVYGTVLEFARRTLRRRAL